MNNKIHLMNNTLLNTRYVVTMILVFLFMRASLSSAEEVVVYTSVDQTFSEPILMAFQEKSGIRVKALYDVEAAKTVGLVNRLLAEKRRPKADVFWNSEVSRTIYLAKAGILAPYKSVHWEQFPQAFKDTDYLWTGFAARARVLIYNTKLLKEKDVPESIFELTGQKWKGRVTMAYPLFGTTATHIAALYSSLGKEKAESFLKRLVDNEVVVVNGNSVTRDLVVEGTVPIGFTDTDDANVAITKGSAVKIIYPDQDGFGTLIIPNTVALIKNGPNPQNGMQLVDYLLTEEVESALAFSTSAQMPLRENVQRPSSIPDISQIKAMEIDYYDVTKNIEQAGRFCQELFIK
ncbi:MAG: iron transporter [Candidatus Scalindua sp.]|nr:MAG: iron transporter [Candidatus Scalindua sp.]